MKKIGYLLTLTLSFSYLGIMNSAQASGGYSARMALPRTGVEKSQVDREKFSLGQRIFAGKVNSGQGDASAQKAKLTDLQSLLPAKLAKEKDLCSLAGKLSPEQLNALDYFVTQRYGKGK
ncbi:MAG: hypothetical protein JNN07_04045 [Verrucomicrobiales bacterium]|nr:hypothetical protein [Verrucomicrobiales bacterium]